MNSKIILKKKVIIIGSYAVGKTSILNSFIHRCFELDYKSTLGVNILAKNYELDEHTIVGFTFWDVGGQKLFRNIYPRFFGMSNAALIVFDVTRMDSFDDIMSWYNLVQNYVQTKIPILLLGNKIDLVDQRVVSSGMAQDLANEQGFTYLETSAKTCKNIDDAFKKLAEILAEVTSVQ
ncbi:MAG: Rab family GTPase [Candidatus Helarchaeota archaeon]